MSRENGASIFSLFPRRLAERDKFDQAVTNHWDCKAVRGADVTYQFLICRTTTLDRDPAARNQNRNLAFGAAAYSILSDGKEAFSTVKLSFGDAPEVSPPAARPADVRPPTISPVGGVWQPADSRLAVADVGEGEFRLRFGPQPWTGKVGSPQVLSNQMMSSLAAAKPQERADYCVWLPGGYPELQAGRLAAAQDFLGGLRALAARGVPIHGECGGYMVLGQGLEDAGGMRHAMAGLLSLETSFAKRRLHLGYRKARLRSACALGEAGTEILGHEFHYASVVSAGDEALVDCRDSSGNAVNEAGARRGSVSGTFFHAICAG